MKNEILSYLPEGPLRRVPILWYDTVDSTNTRAKELLKSGAASGTVLLAQAQTAGRGRQGRSFQSPAGMGIYMSLILRLPQPGYQLMHLTCAAAVAACDGIEKATGYRPKIKWTNDLIAGKRKIAGILTELQSTGGETAAVIGIGVNCNQRLEDFPPELRSFAGSIAMATGEAAERAKLAACLIESLSAVAGMPKEQTMTRYRADCGTLGQDISLVRGDSVRHGHALDIDENGGLWVRFSDGKKELVQSGEVSVRGMYGYVNF